MDDYHVREGSVFDSATPSIGVPPIMFFFFFLLCIRKKQPLRKIIWNLSVSRERETRRRVANYVGGHETILGLCVVVVDRSTRNRALRAFSRSRARRGFGFPGDLSIFAGRARNKVYLQLPLIQLIERRDEARCTTGQCAGHTRCNL